MSGPLKLQRVLPEELVEEIQIRRFRDPAGVDAIIESAAAGVSVVEPRR